MQKLWSQAHPKPTEEKSDNCVDTKFLDLLTVKSSNDNIKNNMQYSV
jgi:hypothetical protein